jgi:hypothetical protein
MNSLPIAFDSTWLPCPFVSKGWEGLTFLSQDRTTQSKRVGCFPLVRDLAGVPDACGTKFNDIHRPVRLRFLLTSCHVGEGDVSNDERQATGTWPVRTTMVLRMRAAARRSAMALRRRERLPRKGEAGLRSLEGGEKFIPSNAEGTPPKADAAMSPSRLRWFSRAPGPERGRGAPGLRCCRSGQLSGSTSH